MIVVRRAEYRDDTGAGVSDSLLVACAFETGHVVRSPTWLLEQLVHDDVPDEIRFRFEPHLLEQPRSIRAHRFRTEFELLRNILHRHPTSESAKNFELAIT